MILAGMRYFKTANILKMRKFISKEIISEVINVFVENKKLRDDRWGTIKIVTDRIMKKNKLKHRWSLVKISFDVDRAFRYVQQHIPEMRGKTWLKRQLQAGEISKDDYDSFEIIKEVATNKQMKFNF